jgi:hypothetical protein
MQIAFSCLVGPGVANMAEIPFLAGRFSEGESARVPLPFSEGGGSLIFCVFFGIYFAVRLRLTSEDLAK